MKIAELKIEAATNKFNQKALNLLRVNALEKSAEVRLKTTERAFDSSYFDHD